MIRRVVQSVSRSRLSPTRLEWKIDTIEDLSLKEGIDLEKLDRELITILLAKILANRLVGVLGDLVNEVQSAFVADRQILDGPFILDEVLQWCRRKKKHALIFKVDFEKAFDSIMGVNVEDGMVKNAASKLGCLVLKTPFTYLGTKVGGNMSRKQAWKEVVDKVPSSILKSLESIRSRFFNGQDPKSNKASWVKWNKVLTPKDKGGLGTNVIKANMGRDEFNRMFLGSSNLLDIDSSLSGVIKELFPRMFALELNKNATVSSKLNASSLDNSFRRKARSGIEEMQLNSLAEISRMTTLVPCEDRYVWTLESDGVFSVASIRKEIDGNRFQDVSLPTRWVKSVPIKVNIIAWKVKSNALPTRFNISRRGMDIDSIVCPICNAGVESTNHIFFQCVVVRQIMRKISSWWNIDYSDVNSYEEWRVWLVSIRIQSKLKGVLEGVYYGLWWYMWNFRNKLLFDKKIPEKALIFDNLVSSSFYWCKFRCKASFKWDDWLKNPYIVLV
ncbi:RNA-directed DNA polymerase, eukaryota [Tanacetum coccineum]